MHDKETVAVTEEQKEKVRRFMRNIMKTGRFLGDDASVEDSQRWIDFIDREPADRIEEKLRESIVRCAEQPSTPDFWDISLWLGIANGFYKSHVVYGEMPEPDVLASDKYHLQIRKGAASTSRDFLETARYLPWSWSAILQLMRDAKAIDAWWGPDSVHALDQRTERNGGGHCTALFVGGWANDTEHAVLFYHPSFSLDEAASHLRYCNASWLQKPR